MIVTRTSDPAAEPVTVATIKTRLIIDHSSHDDWIGNLITEGREFVEYFTGRALINQTWKYYVQNWPDTEYIDIPRPPLSSVTAVRYTDSNGDQTTLSADDYSVDTDSEPGRVVLNYGETWPTVTLATKNPVEIEFVAGYGADATSVPESIITAITLYAKINYDDLPEKMEETAWERLYSILRPYVVRDEFL